MTKFDATSLIMNVAFLEEILVLSRAAERPGDMMSIRAIFVSASEAEAPGSSLDDEDERSGTTWLDIEVISVVDLCLRMNSASKRSWVRFLRRARLTSKPDMNPGRPFCL